MLNSEDALFHVNSSMYPSCTIFGSVDTVELAVDADASLPSRLVIYGISGLLSRNLRVDVYWTGTENR